MKTELELERFGASVKVLRNINSTAFDLSVEANAAEFGLGLRRTLSLTFGTKGSALGKVVVMIGPGATGWCLEFQRVASSTEVAQLTEFLPTLTTALSNLR